MPSQDRRDVLLKEYAEVSSTFRLLTDIRFKLLAFLPLAAGAAAAVIADSTAETALTFSLFGLVVTFGLVTYNARNDQLYDTLIARAAAIERRLGVPDGMFANRPRPWLRLACWRIDHRTGVAAIYLASIALWLSVLLDASAHLVGTAGGGTVPQWSRLLSVALAVVGSLLGAALVAWRRRAVQKALRENARAATEGLCAAGITTLVDEVASASRRNLVELAGGLNETAAVDARLRYLAGLPPRGLDFYATPRAGTWTSAQLVAYVTDLPPEWIYDCATRRRRG